MTRLLAFTLGLAAAAAVLYLLVSGSGRMPVASGPSLDEIDAESRPRVSNRQGGD